MANTTITQIKVDELSKFGFKVGQEYINYSKGLNDSDRALVVPGASFEAELYVADSGKRYLNKIVARAKHVETPKVAPVIEKEVKRTSVAEPQPKPATKTPVSDTMSKDEWAAKDRRISRQGVIQAAVQALTGVYPTVTELYDAAEELALKMLDFVNEVK